MGKDSCSMYVYLLSYPIRGERENILPSRTLLSVSSAFSRHVSSTSSIYSVLYPAEVRKKQKRRKLGFTSSNKGRKSNQNRPPFYYCNAAKTFGLLRVLLLLLLFLCVHILFEASFSQKEDLNASFHSAKLICLLNPRRIAQKREYLQFFSV